MTVRLGFFGSGLIATYHRNMLQLAGADASIVAVHDPDRDRAARFAEGCDASVVESEDEVFAAADAVYVCTWTSEHPRLVAAAAARGLAVFCEKPLAVDLPTALGMVDAVERAGVVNQVGLVLRDSPAFLLLKHLIDDPDSGRVMNVVFRDDQYIPIQGMYASTWRGDPSRAGSGTLLEHSIHDLDLLEFLLGPAVSASGRTAEFHGIAGIEDAVAATIAFESGALVSLISVWHDLLERPSLRRVEVFCERAHFVLDDDVFGPVHWTRPDGDTGSLADEALVAELTANGIVARNPDAAFVEAVAAGAPAYPDVAEALRAHLLTDALYRSAASGGAPVAIPAGRPVVGPR